MSANTLYTDWKKKDLNLMNSQDIHINNSLGNLVNNVPYHNYYKSNSLISSSDGINIFPNYSYPIVNTAYAPYPTPKFALYDEGCKPSDEPSFNLPTALPYMNDWLQRYSKYADNCEFGYKRLRGSNYYNFKTIGDTFMINEKSIKYNQPCVNTPGIYECENNQKDKNRVILQP